jgi:hypothetical protein
VSISDSEDIPANVPIKLKPATENNRTSNGPCIYVDHRQDSRIHEILFRILYHQPVSFSDPDLPAEQLLLKLMDLTRVYDCLNYVKDQLTAEIYTGDCFGREEIAKHPAVFLNIANRLRNKRLFQEALRHAVGQTLQHNKDLDLLENDLKEIVNECADGLASRVKKACDSLYSVRVVGHYLSDFVACSIFLEFLLTNLATKRVASGEMFDTFQYLHKLVSGTELLETTGLGWLLESAEKIRSGTREAITFIENANDSDGDGTQYGPPYLDGLYEMQRLGFTPDWIKATLKNLVTRAQKEIQPLIEAGADYGYFTCMDFKCLYPWEEDTSESLEAE